MSKNAYIENEVAKIFAENEDYTLKSAKAAAWILAHFKGVNLKIYKTATLNPLADYFVLGSVENKVQAGAVADAITRVFKDKELKLKSVEGTDEGEWILIDLGDIIVHVFQETTRDIFDLDTLWKTYPQIDIPNEFYHATPASETEKKEDDLKNYF